MKGEGTGVQNRECSKDRLCPSEWHSVEPLVPPTASSPASPGSGMLLPLGSCGHPRGYSGYALPQLHGSSSKGLVPGQAAVPVLGWPYLGVTSPAWWPQWAVGAQHLLATLAAVPSSSEPPPHPSLPVLTQGDTSWPGHPASRWPLPTACSVWHHLPSPPCPSCVGTASPSF